MNSLIVPFHPQYRTFPASNCKAEICRSQSIRVVAETGPMTECLVSAKLSSASKTMYSPSMENKDESRRSVAKIGSMAARLRDDALLLLENERYSSAYALLILALEEQGKLILWLWNEDAVLPTSGMRMTKHLQKQNAVASLLLTKPILQNFKVLKREEVPHNWPEVRATDIVEAMASSNEAKIAKHIEIGVYDKLKQLAFYHDDWFEEIGISANDICRDSVESLVEMASSIDNLIDNEAAMVAARAMYLSRLGRG